MSALYRVTRAPSLSRRDPKLFLQCVLRNADDVLAIWRAREQLDADRRMALHDAYNYVARDSFRREPELFAHALEQLRAVSDSRTAWPFIAAAFDRVLGHSLALRALQLCGKPAPE